jgi:hypothetical protein
MAVLWVLSHHRIELLTCQHWGHAYTHDLKNICIIHLNNKIFETEAKCFLAGQNGKWGEGGGRTLLGDNTGGSAAMLQPIRLQWAGVRISAGLPCKHVYNWPYLQPYTTCASFQLLQTFRTSDSVCSLVDRCLIFKETRSSIFRVYLSWDGKFSQVIQEKVLLGLRPEMTQWDSPFALLWQFAQLVVNNSIPIRHTFTSTL